MKGVTLQLSLLAAAVLWTTPSWGQFAPQAACQNESAPRTSVYYVNGVTTTLDEARLNGGKLELEFLGKLPSLSPALKAKCYEFFLNYNPTSGAVKDFTEAGQQALGLNPANMWRQLEVAAVLLPGPLAKLQGPMTNANQIDQPAIQRHANAYREKMTQSGNSCRVLVVPHSQGNLYANAAYDVAYTPAPPVDSLRVVGVATPAVVAKGGGRYRTSSGDLLIEAIRALSVLTGVTPLANNTTWGNGAVSLASFSPQYSGGHSYIGYLSHEPSRTNILSDIEASLTALESVVCP